MSVVMLIITHIHTNILDLTGQNLSIFSFLAIATLTEKQKVAFIGEMLCVCVCARARGRGRACGGGGVNLEEMLVTGL
jgi:hypothetical protein